MDLEKDGGEMWIWGRMEGIAWREQEHNEDTTNEEVLHKVCTKRGCCWWTQYGRMRRGDLDTLYEVTLLRAMMEGKEGHEDR